MRSTSWIFNHQRQRKLEMIVFKGSASKAADASQNCFPSPAVSPVLKKKNRVLPTACPRRCPRVKGTVRSRTDVVTGLQHQRAANETGEVSAEPTKYFNIWRYVWKWSQFLNPFPLVCSSFLRPLLIICPVCVVFSFNYTLHKIFICLWVFLHECVCVIPNPVLWWWITASLILHRLRANGTVASIVLEGMTNTYAFGFVPVCVPVGLCVCVCADNTCLDQTNRLKTMFGHQSGLRQVCQTYLMTFEPSSSSSAPASHTDTHRLSELLFSPKWFPLEPTPGSGDILLSVWNCQNIWGLDLGFSLFLNFKFLPWNPLLC